MSFSANALSLSMPDCAFEAWLRENLFLEILDDRTSAIAAPAGGPLPAASRDLSGSARTQRAAAGMSLLSLGATVASLLTVNPFSKLAVSDFAGETPPWTLSFFGPAGSLSWPASPSQVRMRVHENVKRYARNYSILAALFLACSLFVSQRSNLVFFFFFGLQYEYGFVVCELKLILVWIVQIPNAHRFTRFDYVSSSLGSV